MDKLAAVGFHIPSATRHWFICWSCEKNRNISRNGARMWKAFLSTMQFRGRFQALNVWVYDCRSVGDKNKNHTAQWYTHGKVRWLSQKGQWNAIRRRTRPNGDLMTRIKENVSQFSRCQSPLAHSDQSSHNGPYARFKRALCNWFIILTRDVSPQKSLNCDRHPISDISIV
jgi:hypothetical protein